MTLTGEPAIERARPGRAGWRQAAFARRLLFSLLLAVQTLAGTYLMLSILPYHGGDWIEGSMVLLFAILFTWVSTGFWLACLGFVLRRLGGDPFSLLRRHPERSLDEVPLGRTAVVMPVIHEPVDRFMARMRAVYRSIERTGQGGHFDYFILSDSRDPEHWLTEQLAWVGLCRELGAEGRLFYRRRALNLNYKSGNIADFLRRWGRSYDYLVVLDADSLMEGETIVRMVRLMQLEPRIGILQTTPAVINAQSLFARAQQFASRLYGPLFNAGLAALQLGEATFWGHNAILRIRPFMAHCGLRRLKGFGLFRGPVLSHDFAEAALMGRAGYEVWLEPGLGRSYEESPPTLLDEMARDRRWSRGNLQHLWMMLFEPGLRPAHRLVFLSGILSYSASLLWLGFVVLATAEATRFALWPINYFPSERSLFPVWPEWRPEWALGLVGATVVLLFMPKLLGLADALLSRRADFGIGRAGTGGPGEPRGGVGRLLASTLIETLVSALLAPIRMVFHAGYVLEALLNRRLWWSGQNRSEETDWRRALGQHAFGAVAAIAWSAYAAWLSTTFFYWTLPLSIPLVLAAPVSVFLSRRSLGLRARRAGLLLVRNDSDPALEGAGDGRASVLSSVQAAIIDPGANAVHRVLARHRRRGARGRRLAELCARCIEQGAGALSRSELGDLAGDRDSLRLLHQAAWRAPSDTWWGAATRLFVRQSRGRYAPV
jgi:membrane glycosyltransferase